MENKREIEMENIEQELKKIGEQIKDFKNKFKKTGDTRLLSHIQYLEIGKVGLGDDLWDLIKGRWDQKMGFDIIGLNPKNKRGEYFRNNNYWWSALASFIHMHLNCFTEKEYERFYYNSNIIIKEVKVKKIVNFLNNALENKEDYNQWIEKFEEAMRLQLIKFDMIKAGDKYNLPFHWENVREFKEFCEGCRGFIIG